MNSEQQEELRVEVEDGKYTVVMGADGRLHALRYGEQWRDCVGDKLILALAQEVRRLQKALSDSALTALAAETQAEEAYQKQLAAEKRVQELEAELEANRIADFDHWKEQQDAEAR